MFSGLCFNYIYLLPLVLILLLFKSKAQVSPLKLGLGTLGPIVYCSFQCITLLNFLSVLCLLSLVGMCDRWLSLASLLGV